MSDVFDWMGFPAKWVCAGDGRRLFLVKDTGDGPEGWEPYGEDTCACPTCKLTAARAAS